MSAQRSRLTSTSSKETAGDPNPEFIVVDASLWVSRLVPNDVFHQTVNTWMENQRSIGVTLLSPALLIPEVVGTISRRTDEPRLA